MDTFKFVDYILFTDEEELRGTETLYVNLLGRKFNWNKAICYYSIKETIGSAVYDTISKAILKDVLSCGIYVFTLNHEDNNKSDYFTNLQKDIEYKFRKAGCVERHNCLQKEWEKDFFGELYNEEYINKIRNQSYASVSTLNGGKKLKDVDEETYKVSSGERRTVNQPIDYERCIYFYGNCFVIGYYVDDEHTIESYLQQLLNCKGYKVKCINYGVWAGRESRYARIVETRFNKGDIVILYDDNGLIDETHSISLTNACEKNKVPVEWIVDNVLHCNHKVNSIYAKEIFEKIDPIVQVKQEERTPVELKLDVIGVTYIDRFFYGFAQKHTGIVGSIVMNCNPFTFGHRYLIEQACNYVNHLIIFVVEEDSSLFTFKERFAMVKEGTKDMSNVIVVPSGSFILSQTTFPEYFKKIEDEDIIQNVEHDITLFAEQIAPRLNITYRFVGEEPEDKVTNKYNEAMKRILPKHGINVVEISRIKNNRQIISASLVRKKLIEGENAQLSDLIPKTTKEILGMC